jgi:hypothetical protein
MLVDPDGNWPKWFDNAVESMRTSLKGAWNSITSAFGREESNLGPIAEHTDLNEIPVIGKKVVGGSSSSVAHDKGPEFTGDFWDWANKIDHLGKREWNGYYIDDAGNVIGIAPIGGVAPVPSLSKFNPRDIVKLGKTLRKLQKKGIKPLKVDRVDNLIKTDPMGNPLFGQKPHVHLKDGRAFHLDGTWKHGEGDICKSIVDWIMKYADL